MEQTTTITDHPLADIDRIRVDPDDVIDCIQQNHETYQHDRSERVLRITPPLNGHKRAKPHTDLPGYYPNEPRPIHIDPFAFIVGDELGHESPTATEIPAPANYPDQHEERGAFRRDETCDEWDDWWETTLDLWEAEARAQITDTDELIFRPRTRNGTTIEIPIDITDD
jgi:hypothetical protein